MDEDDSSASKLGRADTEETFPETSASGFANHGCARNDGILVVKRHSDSISDEISEHLISLREKDEHSVCRKEVFPPKI